jgi:DNA polymerase III sliding clamp (beta) subunit (PCNA family)
MTIDRKAFAQAMKHVVNAVGKNPLRPIQQGILFEHEVWGDKHLLALTATNGVVANKTRIKIDRMDGIKAFDSFIVEPFKVDGKGGSSQIEILIDDFGDVIYKDDRTTTYLTRIEGAFNDVERLMDFVPDHKFGIDVKLLAAATKGMSAEEGKSRVEVTMQDGVKPILLRSMRAGVDERTLIMPLNIK